MSSALLPETRAVLSQGMADGLHLGAQMALHHAGRTIDLVLGDAASGQPLRPGHILPWRSAGKPVTAVAVALLWQRFALDLDDPVARYIPEFAQTGKQRITLRHLLTHTAGVRRLVPADTAPWEAHLARLCEAPAERNWLPGRRAGYDIDSAWMLLAELVHRVDGRPIERFAHEEIFRPLGMVDCCYCLDAARYAELADRIVRLALTHVSPPVYAETDRPELAPMCRPGSSLRGPARELLKLMAMLLRRGDGLLWPMTVDAMTTRQRCGLFDQSFQHIIDFGLGLIINSAQYGAETVPYGFGPHASPRAFGHGGRQMGVAMVDPEHHLALVLLFNGACGEARHDQRLRAVLAAVYRDLGLVA